MRTSRAAGLLLFIWCVVSAGAAEPAAYSRAVSVTPLLRTQTDGAGKPLAYPVHAPAEITGVLVEIAPGQQTNWHQHPVPCVAYMLEGEVQVELPDGTVKTFRAGDAFAEVVQLLHNGRNPGPKPAKLVMFALGTVGQPYAVKAEAPPAK
ncbi:MAG: cupin domain-containing protein [Candidatus Didemnitutus sp.]|nr:cupin domain-containing protein [Candidatus Didemnitutus sp.]